MPALSLHPRPFCIIDAGSEDFHRLGSVLMLRFSSCWLTTMPVGRWGCAPQNQWCSPIAHWPNARKHRYAIRLDNVDIDILGLGQHGHRSRRGVNTSPVSVPEHVNPMHPDSISASQKHPSRRLWQWPPCSHQCSLGHCHHFKLPTMLGRKSLVHGKQIGSK